MSTTQRDDLLVAQADDDVHDAVRAAVLRADVQEHDLGVGGELLEAPLLGPEGEHLLPLGGALGRHREAAELGAPAGRLLAQRVALPPGRHEDARAAAGRPSKPTPNMSQTSRSYQSAAGNTPVIGGQRRASRPAAATLRRTSRLCSSDSRW